MLYPSWLLDEHEYFYGFANVYTVCQLLWMLFTKMCRI